MLGAGWDGPLGWPPVAGHCYLLAVAGVQGATPRQCSSGVVIVKVHQVTGAYQLMQVGSTIYSGANMVHLELTIWGLHGASKMPQLLLGAGPCRGRQRRCHSTTTPAYTTQGETPEG
ncbi:hypothetical protein PF005_g29908 [Phytophthora fragariae]|uniref:Uncharacterized protein n=1 Tax=Phytophthora fragariae TaxID=53985 RepID=A0A6A3PYM1_9STRA|nr:hypothetical protein PF009_g19340 [Phytophthora fragariae]KAE9065219.1 hypothetical protein PF007_g28920 [Phytophthora fragariae]KAE9123678.1 hypothetical protein PF006_g17370 [Phytophthora fragariae]KAE9164716.1 hypothetical protein PF005_g29908 [Phytophthora fragariae]KAE9207644.1 hypothetical protein PF002_g19645 [Phytophthora fragariae]